MVLYFFLSGIYTKMGFEQEKKKLIRLYESLEKDVNEYKNYVVGMKEKMEQDTNRLLRKIEASKEREEDLTLKSIKKWIDPQAGAERMKQTGHAESNDGNEEHDRKDKIKECTRLGLDPLQIARKLNVSISEVELVLGLDSALVHRP